MTPRRSSSLSPPPNSSHSEHSDIRRKNRKGGKMKEKEDENTNACSPFLVDCFQLSMVSFLHLILTIAWSRRTDELESWAIRKEKAMVNHQSVRTLHKMALLRCCGREALVHKWRTRKKEKAVCTTCQIVTLREKLKSHHSVEGRFVCVYLTRSCVFGILGCCFAKIIIGKKHEEVDRHWNSWLSTIGRLPWKQDVDSKIGDPRTMGKLSGTCFFLVNLFLHLGPLECSQSFCWVVWVLKMLPDI